MMHAIRESHPQSVCLDGSGSGQKPIIGAEKAMAKKQVPKRKPRTKVLRLAKETASAPGKMKRIRGLLTDRGVPGLREFGSLYVAIDPCCTDKASPSRFGDVSVAMVGSAPFWVARARGMPPVRCALSGASTRRLKNGSLRPAKSAPIIYSMAVALRASSDGSAAAKPPAELWVVEAELDPSD